MHVCMCVPKRKHCLHIKKKGLGSRSDFSGSFGQLSSGCGLVKEKMSVCSMNAGGSFYFLMEVQQVKYLNMKGYWCLPGYT